MKLLCLCVFILLSYDKEFMFVSVWFICLLSFLLIHMFVYMYTELLVNLQDSREQVEGLLTKLPAMFANTTNGDSCFFPAVQVFTNTYKYIHIYIYISVYISIYISIYISVYISVYISIYISICISIYTSIYILQNSRVCGYIYTFGNVC